MLDSTPMSPPARSGRRFRESIAPREALGVARGLLACPTATYLEHGPAAFVRTFAAARPGLAVTEDRAGNLLVSLGAKRGKPALVLVAHLDHPAFVVDRVERGVAMLSFRGGVRLPHAKRGTKLAFFAPGVSRAKARGTLLQASGDLRSNAGDAELRPGAS